VTEQAADEQQAAAEQIYRPDADEFRAVLGQFATGVTIITAVDGDEPVGVAANSFTSVSLDPPLVLFCVARTSSTWPRIEQARKFAVNILGEHQEELSGLFAKKGADRFGHTDWHLGVGGSPVLHDTLAYLDCEFWNEYDGGDHIIVVGRVLDLGLHSDAGPLLFFRGKYGRIADA
jgi:flavin reductase (DIM6/NTAB) family NADH-FMN oxidoreductase RutF